MKKKKKMTNIEKRKAICEKEEQGLSSGLSLWLLPPKVLPSDILSCALPRSPPDIPVGNLAIHKG